MLSQKPRTYFQSPLGRDSFIFLIIPGKSKSQQGFSYVWLVILDIYKEPCKIVNHNLLCT